MQTPTLPRRGRPKERERRILLYRTKNGVDGQTATRVAPSEEGGTRERGVISTPLKCKTASADRFGAGGLPPTGGVQTAHSREMAKTARPLVDWLSGYKVAEKRTPHDMGQKGTAPVPPLVMTDEVLNVTLEGRMNVREWKP